MEIAVRGPSPLGEPTQALVVGCFEKELSGPFVLELDSALTGCITAAFEAGEFTGQLNKTLLFHTLGRISPQRVLLVGLGVRQDMTLDRLRQAAGTAAQVLQRSRITKASSILHYAAGEGADWLKVTVEGYLLGSYVFERYKSDPADHAVLETMTLLHPHPAAESTELAVTEARVVCDSVLLARELVDQPCNIATPAFLAKKAQEISAAYGIACRVMEREEMERLGMDALLSVAKGSSQSPRFIIMEYRGPGAKKRPTVLVGKGITFDSGGISLKPREGMEKMKNDMAGGAAVIGAMAAVARLELPLNVIGLVAAAENLPDGSAFKPGDVIRTMAGKSVEIVNTDAEGRLVLCDALHYAQQYRPAAIIDVATLTGACVVALGAFATGVMGTDRDLVVALKKAGEETGERVWELPLWEAYGELMKSDIADFKNAGGPTAGAISAGWFLRQFAGKSRWVHLDIAGTAWEEKGRPYLPKGATGVGVRLLVEYLRGIKR